MRWNAGALAGALALLVAGPAFAEVGASISVVSDDVFRGLSVSGGRPTASLDGSYEAPFGGYLGASATAVATAHSGVEWLRAEAYAGYAHRLSSDLTADVGLTHSEYTEYYAAHEAAAYSEAYVGLMSRHLSGRLYYSPSYFGSHARTLYGEVEGSVRPQPDWRLSAHVGLLSILGGERPPFAPRSRFDWRLGIARDFKILNVQLAVTGAEPEPSGYAQHVRRGSAVVFGLTHAF